MVSADSLFKNVNNILDLRTQNSLRNSVNNLENTLQEVKKMMLSVNSMIDSTSVDLKESVKNTRLITENFSKVSDTLANANIGGIMRKAEITLNSANLMLEGINQGKGTIGKLVTDDELYNNIAAMSKELEDLLKRNEVKSKKICTFFIIWKKSKSL